MDKLITRIALMSGWNDHHQSYKVQYQIDTKEWPWSKSVKRWCTSRSFNFDQYSQDQEDEALRAACRWQHGIETTGDPDVSEIINLQS